MVFSSIPLPSSNPMDAFIQGANTSQNMFNSMMQNKYVAANTQAQLLRNPFIAPQSQANLTQTQLANQMYIPKTNAEIDLERAQAGDAGAAARLKNQLYNNPSLGRAGIVGDIAASNYNPSGNNAVNQTAPISQVPNQTPMTAPQVPQSIPNAAMQSSSQPNLMQQIQAGLTPQGLNSPSIPQMPANNGIPQPIQSPSIIPQSLTQRALNAELAEEEAKAKWYSSGMMGMGRGGVAIQQQRQLQTDIARDNPNFTDDQAYNAAGNILQGKESLDDGTPINVSGITRQNMINFQDSKATPQVKNQAANYDVLVNDMQNIPIDTLAKFAGPQGKIQLALAKAKMAADPNNPSIDPEARKYITAVTQTIGTMDQMRKAFGTSVVPDYVYKTVGKMTNPSSDLFTDPKQVVQTYQGVLKQMSDNRDQYMAKVRGGVTANANQVASVTSTSGTTNGNSSDTQPPIVKWKKINGKYQRIS